MLNLTLRWVPGTLNRVQVNHSTAAHEVLLSLIARELGRPAIDALHLKGLYRTSVSPSSSPLPVEVNAAA
ncbi:hypothetical protein SAMN00790413_05141 [Deinococcus hopiensis KR-140]|uniref:Uncharacterized protein n=1 Tax=Deinococcus hopiensis KR-140 TaxID=695939 RepID=A0A1W1UTT3_9DEIO|nr:hypothetical protein SAMN00790413_05141 [Deinococcus hopiensis KR-140]